MEWSNYQKEIFNTLQTTNKNINISATAGSGKTTVLLECLRRIPSHKDSIFLSFSNTIVDELKSRVPSYVEASTLHSLGCRIVMGMYKKISFNPDKYMQLALESYTKKEFSKKVFIEAYTIQDICNFMRMTLTPQTPEEVKKMCIYYNIEFTDQIIDKSIELVEKNTKRPKSFDFTDMIYIPAIKPQLIPKCYDYVFLDEAQDSNNAQIAMVEGLLKQKGRLISCGDLRQTIYAFAGSNIDSFKAFSERPNTVTLPLSISYRCAKKIVYNAQQVYEEIETFDNAKDGMVLLGNHKMIQEGDMVLCRNNAPLVSLYFDLIEREVKASIRGKEIEEGLLKLVESCMSATEERFLDRLEAKLERVAEKLKSKGVKKYTKRPEYQALFEKIEIVLLILNKVELKMLVSKIKEIFHDNGEGVLLLTIHKSKGLEAKRVFMIEMYNGDQLIPSKHAASEWELIQERNLLFVGLTRAKEELIYIKYND